MFNIRFNITPVADSLAAAGTDLSNSGSPNKSEEHSATPTRGDSRDPPIFPQKPAAAAPAEVPIGSQDSQDTAAAVVRRETVAAALETRNEGEALLVSGGPEVVNQSGPLSNKITPDQTLQQSKKNE